MTAESPYFWRMESRVLSRAASFSREGEAGVLFLDVPMPESEWRTSSDGRSNKESWTGSDTSINLEERTPKRRMGEQFHSSSNR